MITGTMTRPTPIAPTLTCDRKVYFVERIDISPLQPPRPRTITLEPISKRTRAKSQARKLVDPGERKARISSTADRVVHGNASIAYSTHSSHAESDTPGSPGLSEISFDSRMSSTGHTSRPDTALESQGTDEHSGTSTSKGSEEGSRTIHATVESLNGGCLRGDAITIKVHVDHTKLVRSLYGVIVTLYRQARVDMHPAIPLGPAEKGADSKYEDYYPRSLTGLGGLSLSGAGSSHVFRKDLAQTMAPLLVDPASLTAEVNAKIRVPEDAFPTISSVPGAMISFKYYVEVILDLQGKLGSNDRSLGNLGGLTTSNSQSHMGGGFGNVDTERMAGMPFGSPIIDTTQIRRDKGVVTCTFETVVGTRDSERRKGKKKVQVTLEDESEPVAAAAPADSTQHAIHWYDEEYGYDNSYYDNSYWHEYPPEGGPPDGQQQAIMQYVTGASGHDQQPYDLAPPVPIPSIPDESQMSEKDRLRAAEMRLLPSQPPGMEANMASGDVPGPSAPFLPDLEGEAHAPMAGPSAPAYQESGSAGQLANEEPSVPSIDEVNAEAAEDAAQPHVSAFAAPNTADHSAAANVPVHAGGDTETSVVPEYQPPNNESSSGAAAMASDEKRELEQHFMQTETPTQRQADDSTVAGPSTTTGTSAPNASVPTEHNHGQAAETYEEADGQFLPKYER